MDNFDEAYQSLNTAQRQAVDSIDGPLLVIAGPGTGKTQLLSARVANILRVTDTPPQNILCLTFTENGAENMRERLSRFIGQAAYDVTISTYHAFGGDLIRRYPEYFASTRMQNPVDELGKRQILLDIVEHMSYANPLKQSQHHIGDLISTISEVKRALLTPDALRTIARENAEFITSTKAGLASDLEGFTIMPRKFEKAAEYFTAIHRTLQSTMPPKPAHVQFGSLVQIAADELEIALEKAAAIEKTKPLTEWKNKWLVKDEDNNFMFAGGLETARIRALATVLEQYTNALEEAGLYDFDDMILRSIAALETHHDLRYTLQERYLYILLDEFQDTNAAQLKLIELLTNNPVSEGRPNIMAVGDDDQAIYAFQGAQYSNMIDFLELYQDVKVINLTENYRSAAEILTAAEAVAGQIESRLVTTIDTMDKTLTAANKKLQPARIERLSFQSPIAERHWIAARIRELLDEGVSAGEITVLAPKHKHLEPLVPYLNSLGIPVRYEKRENILDAPVVRQILTMGQLILALEADNQTLADHLWPQVLSYDFWQLPTAAIWQKSWQVTDSHADGMTWSKALLDDARFRLPALLFLTAATKVHSETAETILDYVLGNVPVQTHESDLPEVISPLKSFYTSPEIQAEQPEVFYETVSHLAVLRARLLEHIRSTASILTLRDFMHIVAMYEEAEQPMINTSPYAQQEKAVTLMTVFKAKGLEFEHVFLPGSQDEVWGSSSRDNSNKLTLPANLQPIRHAGVSDDERLRILFVAITRAKYGLYLTSSTYTFNGKNTKRLKYLDEREDADNVVRTHILPEAYQKVQQNDQQAPAITLLELDWRTRHVQGLADIHLRGLLHDRLQKYRFSPTHLTDFVNLEYAGPQRFYLKTLLKFPETPLPNAQFGTVIHDTLEWVQHRTSERGDAPPLPDVLQYFRTRMNTKRLSETRTALEIERGESALTAWYKARAYMFKPGDVAEKNFHNEGVMLDEIPLAGRVDRLEIDKNNKTITVVDYKTGNPHSSWRADPKLHRYRLQLYAYKLLIENSLSYRGYTVKQGRLEFIEPDSNGKVHQLELTFNDDEFDETKRLIRAVWQHVQNLNFPDTSAFPVTMTGIKEFEKALLDGNI